MRTASSDPVDPSPMSPPTRSVVNLRDLGGHRTSGGGRVRSGLLFRSGDLGGPSDATAACVADLGIRAVYDLRTVEERTTRPDHLPGNVAYVIADVLADTSEATSPGGLAMLLRDPRTAATALGDGGAERIFTAKYREFVTLPSALRAYRRLFEGIIAHPSRPSLFHCATGKDRTGWAAAALLLVVGVPEDEVLADYLRMDPALRAQFEPHLRAFAANGGDPALLEPMVGVRPEYLAASLETVRTAFGSIAGYFAGGLGIDAAAQRLLHDSVVRPA
jgi:protein-tyrosine phosphatase